MRLRTKSILDISAARPYTLNMDTAVRVTAEEREAYERDGVVCLRNVFEPKWIDLLREANERPLPSVRVGRDDQAGRFVAKSAHTWMVDSTFADFVLNSR